MKLYSPLISCIKCRTTTLIPQSNVSPSMYPIMRDTPSGRGFSTALPIRSLAGILPIVGSNTCQINSATILGGAKQLRLNYTRELNTNRIARQPHKRGRQLHRIACSVSRLKKWSRSGTNAILSVWPIFTLRVAGARALRMRSPPSSFFPIISSTMVSAPKGSKL